LRRSYAQFIGPAILLALSALPAPASAHVGSSEKVNNRYYKITPMADRVRVAYTIFFGRLPGMQIRRRMDLNHDGQLSGSEAQKFAEQIATELRKSVSADLGESGSEIRWKEPAIGIGTPNISGGPFSVDLVGTLCLAEQAGQEHRFVFRDRMRLPLPGETELFLDPAPGIVVTKSELDGRPARSRGEKWQGGPGPARQGYELRFIVESDETAGMDSACDPEPARESSTRTWILVASAAGLLLCGLLLFLRRRVATRR
jgi:hypothetical protein